MYTRVQRRKKNTIRTPVVSVGKQMGEQVGKVWEE